MDDDCLDLYLPDTDSADSIIEQVRIIDRRQLIIEYCSRFPQAFRLLPHSKEPEEQGWSRYIFDDQCSYWIRVDHPEALKFFEQSLKEEREAIMSQALAKKEEDSIKQMLSANIRAVKSVLPKHMTPERMMRIAFTAISRNPTLARCTPISLLNAVIEASMLGLEVNSPLGQASMVPYWNSKNKQFEAQLIPEYKGKIELAYRSGMVRSFQAHPVFEKDTFQYSYGLTPDLVHIPSKEADRGKLVAAYAVVNYLNGGVDFEVIEEAEAMKAKAKSASAKQDEKNKTSLSVWNSDDEPAMWVKTAVHRLFKRVPKSPEYRQLARAQELSEQAEAQEPQDFDWLDVESVKGELPNGNGAQQGAGEQPPASEPVTRKDADNKVWKQLDAMKKAVPEIYEQALKELKMKEPVTVEDAEQVMARAQVIADGGER